MADYAYFYNSQNGDRIYDADSFSDWLKKFFTTGVFEGDLQVLATEGMGISVNTGYVNIEGKVRMFDNATDFTIATASPTYNRIDTVIAERNDTDRNITLKVVTGGYASEPTPTAPVRANGIYQLVLAEIYVAAGATGIEQQDITDKRTDTDVCGYVYTPVDDFDYDQFATQFNDWFEHIKGQIGTDAAVHLQNEIDGILAKINGALSLEEINAATDTQLVGKLPNAKSVKDLNNNLTTKTFLGNLSTTPNEISTFSEDFTHYLKIGFVVDSVYGTYPLYEYYSDTLITLNGSNDRLRLKLDVCSGQNLAQTTLQQSNTLDAINLGFWVISNTTIKCAWNNGMESYKPINIKVYGLNV